MSYCCKCGAKLDEDARFCRVCGAPVTGTAAAPTQASMARRVRRPFILPVAILIAILGVAFVFAVFAFAPFQSVNFNQSNSAAAVPGVDTVNLNFQADVADVNVIPTSQLGDLVRVDVSASGSTGLFGSTTHPVKVTFSNETSDGTMTVTSKVIREELWPFSFNLHVVCNVYVDTSAVVNVTAQSTVGKVVLDTNFLPVTFDAVNLHSTTGSIQATLSPNAVFKGNISASSTTGGIQLVWSNAKVAGNTSISLASTTGAISADIGQTSGALGGNVALEARTTTGSVECAVTVGNSVGSQITSHSSTGSILVVDTQNFNGNKSPIYSSNYPAENNFLVNLASTTGSIRIAAFYQGQSADVSVQEQVRDAVMAYIQANHSETAPFIANLAWTGGRVDTGLLGAEKYIYSTLKPGLENEGWTVTLDYPVIPNPVYTIKANYTQAGPGAPDNIVWGGTWQNGAITESSYNFNLPSTQEQVRNSIMTFIQIHHNETAQFMQNLNWTGGRVDRGLIVGAGLYTYISGGWNVTMTYPVYPNPIYTVTADYSSPSLGIPYRVIWEGTWQNGTIIETSYIFAQ